MVIGDKVRYKNVLGEIVDLKKDVFGDEVYCVVLENGQKIWAYGGFLRLKRRRNVSWNREALKEQKANEELKKKIEEFCQCI